MKSNIIPLLESSGRLLLNLQNEIGYCKFATNWLLKVLQLPSNPFHVIQHKADLV